MIYKSIPLRILFFLLCTVSLSPQTQHLFPSASQRYSIRVWSEETFNPGGTMGKIVQDDRGFLWLASNNGLFRFDGFRFFQYTLDNTPAIRSSLISDMFRSANGTIYLSNSAGGLLYINPESSGDELINANLPAGLLNFITGDNSGTIWGNVPAKGIYKITAKERKFFDNSKYLPDNRVSAVQWLQGQGLWVGLRNSSILRFDENKNHTVYTLPRGIPAVFELVHKNELLIGSSAGLYRLSGKELNRVSIKNLPDDINISAIEQDNNKNIWLGTRNYGIFILHPGGAITHLSDKNGLSGTNVTSLCFSKEKIMWAALAQGGINAIEEAHISVYTAPDELPHANVRCVYAESPSSLWVGTDSGVVHFTPSGKTFILPGSGFPRAPVYTILRGSGSRMYFGTRAGLVIMDAGRVSKVLSEKSGINSDFIRILYKDRDGSIWVGTNGGGISILKGDSLRHITSENGLTDNFISSILRTKQGDMWVATSGGGVTIFRKNGTIDTLNARNGLKVNTVVSLFEDFDGAVWLTSNGGGIVRSYNDSLFSFTTNTGLPDNRVFKLVKDRNNRYWFSTRSGIFSFRYEEAMLVISGRKKILGVSRYGKNDGLLSERCNGLTNQSGMLSAEGDVVFSTTDGFAVIPEDLPETDKTDIPVYIYRVTVDDSLQNASSAVVVPAGSDKISLYYSGLALRNTERIKFIYRMEGLQQNWHDLTPGEPVVFNNIPPGKYVFHISTRNGEGEYSTLRASLPVVVNPYIYQTVWFRTFVILLLVAAIFFGVRFLLNRRYREDLQRMEARHALEKERMRISKDMHDELGASLTKLSLLSEIAAKKSGPGTKVVPELEKIAATAREMSSTMDEIVWAINPRNDTLENLIGYILRFTEELISFTSIDLSMNIPAEIPDRLLPADIRHNLFLTTKEALNNAVKYSCAEKIVLRIHLEPDYIEIIVRDNGKGFDVESAGDSSRNGLRNMKRRIEEIHGTFAITSEPQSGTEVAVRVQLSS